MGRKPSARCEYASKAPATRSKYQPCRVSVPASSARRTLGSDSRLRSEIRMDACSQARRRSASGASGIWFSTRWRAGSAISIQRFR